MEAKKSIKADLEKKKGLFLEIGLVVALVASLVAFNIKSYDQEAVEVSQRTAIDEIEDVVIQTAEELPPPPPPETPEITTEITIVEDDVEIENELGIIDMGDNANQAQEAFVPVAIEEDQVEEEEDIVIFVEEQPQFPGGEEALYTYLRDNIKYPQLARDNNITGKVFVQFVVEKDGSISNAKVMRDIGGGCGNEALRVVKSMPKWKPGKQQGRAVRAQFNLPVAFNLR